MKYILKILIVLTFLSGYSYSQNIDSIYNQFLQLHNQSVSDEGNIVQSTDDEPGKCGTFVVNYVKQNLHVFTKKQQMILKKMLSRPDGDTSFVSPKGYFRIHYKKSGSSAPEYDLNELADALDYSYEYEINTLNYETPPSDGSNGGDDLYDIYIKDINDYGYTEFEDNIGGEKYISFMVIDNDFSNNYTKGIDGAKVTVAHEFHHAIQGGAYAFRNADAYYHEMTSVTMEELVFDEINDYYQYIRSYFYNTTNTISSYSGYNLALWNLFLIERLEDGKGLEIIKRSWERMRSGERAVTAIKNAVSESEEYFGELFNEFGVWCVFSGNKQNSENYFEEGANYPSLRPTTDILFNPPTKEVVVSTSPVSNSIIRFYTVTGDTIYTVVTNQDVKNAVENISGGTSFSLKITNDQSVGSGIIRDDWYYDFSSMKTENLVKSFIFNYVPINNGGDQIADEIVFPQPFRYNDHVRMQIPAKKSPNNFVELYIYTVNMKLIYSEQNMNLNAAGKFVSWDGRNNDDEKLSTGVYIYVTKSGNEIKKGKLVIYNE